MIYTECSTDYSFNRGYNHAYVVFISTMLQNMYDLRVCRIFSRQASLTRQAFLITALHGARYKTGKTLTPKSSAM